MKKESRFMNKTAWVICLCMFLGIFVLGNPQAAYGLDMEGLPLDVIKIEVTKKSSWDRKFDPTFYKEIENNYKSSYDSADRPLQLNNEVQLAAFAKFVNETPDHNFQGKYVELMDDIDFMESNIYMELAQYTEPGGRSVKGITMKGEIKIAWVPIGIDGDHRFQGTFDGKNHVIQNIAVLNESASGDDVCSGFFGVLGGNGTIQNLGIEGGNVLSSTLDARKGASNAGGLAGINQGSIKASYNTGGVASATKKGAPAKTTSKAGGLVGVNKGSIETSYSTGDVMSYVKSGSNGDNDVSAAGGLVGMNDGSIKSSYSTGAAVSSGEIANNVGGLAGRNSGSIKTSYSTGAASSSCLSVYDSRAGGLVGYNRAGSIETSYSTGDVTSVAFQNFSHAGGLVGVNEKISGKGGSIKASYSTGAVTCRSYSTASGQFPYAGGLVGSNAEGTVENCYRNAEAIVEGTKGIIITDMGIPLNPRQMTGTGPGRANTMLNGFDGDIWGFQQDDGITGPDGRGIYSQTWYYPSLQAMTYTEDRKPKYIKTGSRLSSEIDSLKITGTRAVGEKLTAEVTGTNPNGLQYQWYVEGVGNRGTDKTYTVKEEDVGKKVIATVHKEACVGTLDYSVEIPCSVEIENPEENHIRWISGSQSQSGIIGAMEEVVYEAKPGWYFPEDYSVDPVNGVKVTRNSNDRITVSGTPTANVSLTLNPAAEATYAIMASPGKTDFGIRNEGYAQPAAQTVTVENTGNNEVKLSQPISMNYEIGGLSKTTLQAGGTAEFTVRPKADLKAGNYSETIEVATDHGTKATVDVYFKVNGAFSVAIDPSKAEIIEGASQTLKATPKGGSGNYTYEWYAGSETMPFAKAREVIVSPKTTTTYKVVVTDTVENKEARATVTVIPATYTITAAPAEPNFGIVNEGYVQPGAKIVTISNTGNSTVKLNQPKSSNYEIRGLSLKTLKAGESAEFTVRPKANLKAGTYQEAIEVTTDQGTKAAVKVSFKVNEALSASIDPAGATIIEGQSQKLKANPKGGSGSYTYKWYKGAETKAFDTKREVTVSPAATTTYRVVVSDTIEEKEATATVTVTPATADAPKILEGAGGIWIKGSKDGLTFKSDSAFDQFRNVTVDTKKLTASNYTAKAGSTIVTLKPEYLETLPLGKHTIGIVAENGIAETTFTIIEKGNTPPGTGDSSHMGLWFTLLFLSGSFILFVIIRKRKNLR